MLDLGSIQRQQTRGAGRLSDLNGKAGFERSFCFELGTFETRGDFYRLSAVCG